MPGLGGIEATRRILRGSPHISILVLSMFDDDDSIFAALQAGARGYLLKGAVKSEILRAVRAVASGEAIFGPEIARRLIDSVDSPTQRPQPTSSPNSPNANIRSLHLSRNTRPTPQIARQSATESQRQSATTYRTSSPSSR